ncbi:MAG: excalibur calcium-binding domain-containing protein [Rivularia sp. (in: cyanobacteria)]
MNKTFILTIIALTIAACDSTSTKKPVESSQLQEPIAETTPVSRIVPEEAPSSIPTFKAVPKSKPIKPVIKSVKPEKPAAKSIAQTSIPTLKATPSIKETVKPVINKTGVKSTNNAEKPVAIDKLVADISDKIGCGKVNQKYKIQVATIAIANYNPQSLQGLSRKQIRQAVKKSIADYPERAEGLVQEYRSQYCTVAKNPTEAKSTVVDKKQQVTTTTGEVIPAQSGTCKELKAKGIKNIDVAVNPWAIKKDRDNDGIACESK